MPRNITDRSPTTTFRNLLSPDFLESLARSCGLMRRRSAKLTPGVILASFLSAVTFSEHSFFGLASLASLCSGRSICRQAVHRRFGPPLAKFLRSVLAHLISAPAPASARPVLKNLGPVRRILAQDSVHTALHPCLKEDFPGSSNQNGGARAALKIQATLDILAHRFVAFSSSGFNRNDQAAAPDILAHLQPGDLVLRDLGYFTLASLRSIGEAGAFFVSRYSKATLFEPSGESIDLGERLLHRHARAVAGTCLDLPVLLGAEQRLPVRFVAVRLPAEVAAERRRKALNNRDARLKPTQASLALLDWSLYVTNLPTQPCGAACVAGLYGLRWRIEILFKSLKSQGLRMPAALDQAMNKDKLEALIDSALILAVLNSHAAGAPPRQQPLRPVSGTVDTGPGGRPKAGRQKRRDSSPARGRSVLRCARVMRWLLLPLLLEWLKLPPLKSFEDLFPLFEPKMRYEKRDRSTFLEILTDALG
jgi:hypothetical protein